jgi:hypothetical protein
MRGGLFLPQKSSVSGKAHDGADTWYPRFVYFCKFDAKRAPCNYQRQPRGDIYEVTVLFDEPKDSLFKYGGYGACYAMWVDEDGSITMLKENKAAWQPIRTKRSGYYGKRGEVFHVPQRKWQLPSFITSWCKEPEVHPANRNNPQALALSLFTNAANYYEAMNAGIIRVHVSRDKIIVPFSVNIKRTPYFFKDRDLVITAKGKKARIFHIVRPHVRANGSAVRMHFRGLRRFVWNGYDVNITVPGKHHYDLTDFDVPAVPEEKINEPGITSGQLAKGLASHIDGVPLEKALEFRKQRNAKQNSKQD